MRMRCRGSRRGSRLSRLKSRLPTLHQGIGCFNEWDRAVTALEVAALQVLVLARLEVGQGVEVRRPFLVLLHEPDLVPAQMGAIQQIAQQGRIMGIEDELPAPVIARGILKKSDEFEGEMGM